jgi:hypothetical protein
MGANFDLVKWGGYKNDYQPNLKGTGYTNEVDPYGNLKKAAGGTAAPGDAPDATDEVVRQRQAAEMTRLMLGFGRKSTFSEGGMGDLRLSNKSLTGGT